MQRTVNIFEAGPIDGRVDLADIAGSGDTAAFAYDIAPGESSCPYHYEYVEEWLAGAHKLSNRGEVPCRLLLFSEARAPAVSVYPDSDKLGVWPAPAETGDELIFLRSSAVPWSHGEDGWQRAG